MGKVTIFKSMSLDGFIAGPNDEIDPLHDWLFTERRRTEPFPRAVLPLVHGAAMIGV